MDCSSSSWRRSGGSPLGASLCERDFVGYHQPQAEGRRNNQPRGIAAFWFLLVGFVLCFGFGRTFKDSFGFGGWGVFVFVPLWLAAVLLVATR